MAETSVRNLSKLHRKRSQGPLQGRPFIQMLSPASENLTTLAFAQNSFYLRSDSVDVSTAVSAPVFVSASVSLSLSLSLSVPGSLSLSFSHFCRPPTFNIQAMKIPLACTHPGRPAPVCVCVAHDAFLQRA